MVGGVTVVGGVTAIFWPASAWLLNGLFICFINLSLAMETFFPNFSFQFVGIFLEKKLLSAGFLKRGISFLVFALM